MRAMQQNTAEALKLWAWIVSGLAVLVASIVLGFVASWQFASITAQLVGSGLAFGGLLIAYLRARNPGETLRQQLREFVRRLFGSNATTCMWLSVMGPSACGVSAMPRLA
jgi:hypothetical protein